jgi:hypothetical protein
MDRRGLADRFCTGSGWVGIRPGAVEAFSGQMLSAYPFQVKPGTEGNPFSLENPGTTPARPRHALPEQLQSALNVPRTCACTGNGSGRGSP